MWHRTLVGSGRVIFMLPTPILMTFQVGLHFLPKGSTALPWPIYYQAKEEWLDQDGFVEKQNELIRKDTK